MSMFDNYNNIPIDYIPCNRIRYVEKCETDNFIIGGTCTFTFSFDMERDDIQAVEFIFKQGINIFTIKTGGDVDIIETGKHLLVETTLSPEETSRAVLGRNMLIQVKFLLTDGTVIYGNKVKLRVVSSLDN